MPPLLLGVINKTKSLFSGRNGPPLLQLYYDLIKLMGKSMVISTTTTWIFIIAPVVTLVTVFLAGMLVPIGLFHAPIAFTGDLIFFAYLLGLARFFTTAAALDTGSPFEGMGAAREVTFACFSEPAMFLAFLVMAKLSGSVTLTTMLHAPAIAFSSAMVAPLVLVSIGFFLVLLSETCRIPVDDPNTHLELTMIHEVMVLDHSGPLLGMILYSASMKLFILGTIFLHMILPFQVQPMWMNWLLFIIEMLGLSVIIGIVESVMARLRMSHVVGLLIAAFLFCGFSFILLIRDNS
jgi:formate hydrogenlyase subunit 4